MNLFDTRMRGTSTEMVSHTWRWNFRRPQVDVGFSEMTGISVPMVMTKKVFQRLVDQVSSRRWDLIFPSQLIVLPLRVAFSTCVYYESIKRKLKIRCTWVSVWWKTKTMEVTHLSYTGFPVELEHLKIETRLIKSRSLRVWWVSMWLRYDRRPVDVQVNT